MTRKATVVRILDDKMAEIMVERVSACGGNCASCGGCGDRNCVVASAHNDINASAGDCVVVESGTSRIMAIAVIVYMIPLLFLLAAYMITAAVGLGEGTSILISAVSFVAGVAMVVVLNRANKIKNAEFHITSFSEGID